LGLREREDVGVLPRLLFPSSVPSQDEEACLPTDGKPHSAGFDGEISSFSLFLFFFFFFFFFLHKPFS